MTPFISICISSSSRFSLLKECLQSVIQQDFPHNQMELLVATESKHIVQAQRLIHTLKVPIQWLSIKNSTSSRNRNAGLENAKGSLLYFLDDDCSLPTKTHLKNLVAYHQRHPEVSLIGGRYSDGYKTTRWGKAYNLVCNSWQDRHHHSMTPTPVDGYVGGNLSLKLNKQTKVFRFGKVSEFGGEEAHYISQLQNSKHQCILVNGLTVHHNAQHDMKTFFSRAWLHGQNKNCFNQESVRKVFSDRNFLWDRRSHFISKSLATLYIGCAQISWLAESTKRRLKPDTSTTIS